LKIVDFLRYISGGTVTPVMLELIVAKFTRKEMIKCLSV